MEFSVRKQQSDHCGVIFAVRNFSQNVGRVVDIRLACNGGALEPIAKRRLFRVYSLSESWFLRVFSWSFLTNFRELSSQWSDLIGCIQSNLGGRNGSLLWCCRVFWLLFFLIWLQSKPKNYCARKYNRFLVADGIVIVCSADEPLLNI